jgi:hypothetical protein
LRTFKGRSCCRRNSHGKVSVCVWRIIIFVIRKRIAIHTEDLYARTPHDAAHVVYCARIIYDIEFIVPDRYVLGLVLGIGDFIEIGAIRCVYLNGIIKLIDNKDVAGCPVYLNIPRQPEFIFAFA